VLLDDLSRVQEEPRFSNYLIAPEYKKTISPENRRENQTVIEDYIRPYNEFTFEEG
jgi:hypothetical protein